MGSSTSIECPPASATPASAHTDSPPCRMRRLPSTGSLSSGMPIIEAIYGGVVAGLGAHQQFGWHGAKRRRGEDFGQNAGRDLAAAAAAVRELGQSDFGVHGEGKAKIGVLFVGSAVRRGPDILCNNV